MSGSQASEKLYILYQPFHRKLCQPFDRQGIFPCVPMQLVVEHAVCNAQGKVLHFVFVIHFYVLSAVPLGRSFMHKNYTALGDGYRQLGADY